MRKASIILLMILVFTGMLYSIELPEGALRFPVSTNEDGKITTTFGEIRDWEGATSIKVEVKQPDGSVKKVEKARQEVRMHKGLDIATYAEAQEVYAAANGRVIFKGTAYGYGNFVIISHGDNFYTAYAHLSKIKKYIKQGTNVSAGQVIGIQGGSYAKGWSIKPNDTTKKFEQNYFGPHLHFETGAGLTEVERDDAGRVTKALLDLQINPYVI